jgi:hypothetical protein
VNPKDNMKNDNYIAPSDGASDEKGKPNAEPTSTPEDWKQLTGGKFKTEAELAKSYKDLETKLGQNSEEIRRSKEFAELMNPLLEEIRNDPEVFNKLDEKLRKRGQPNETPADKTDTKGKVDSLDEVRNVTSEMIRVDFEGRHGISELSPDEQKDMRRKIGDTILRLTGQPFDKVDLRRLGGVLEDAWFLANKDQLVDKSKLESLAATRGVDEASISAIPSSGKKGETNLTPEQAKAAAKLGLSRDQYIAGMK